MRVYRRIPTLALALAFSAMGVCVAPAQEAETPPPQKWSFAGPFGIFDRGQLQRGFKVYREVCSNCHSLKHLAFRNLADPGGPGFSEAQAAAVAAEFKIKELNDQGEMAERPGRIGDHFPPPFANDAAARAANGGSLPPDMSVLAKARGVERGFPWFLLDMFTQYQEGGPDYIHAILLGYELTPPEGVKLPPATQYNKYFPGHAIGMPKPLDQGQVAYNDGTPTTLDQYGRDIGAFLMWAAEPTLEQRKRVGLQVMLFLIVLSGLLYFTKKRVWHAVELHPEDR